MVLLVGNLRLILLSDLWNASQRGGSHSGSEEEKEKLDMLSCHFISF
jgi:hypothetical protein